MESVIEGHLLSGTVLKKKKNDTEQTYLNIPNKCRSDRLNHSRYSFIYFCLNGHQRIK